VICLISVVMRFVSKRLSLILIITIMIIIAVSLLLIIATIVIVLIVCNSSVNNNNNKCGSFCHKLQKVCVCIRMRFIYWFFLTRSPLQFFLLVAGHMQTQQFCVSSVCAWEAQFVGSHARKYSFVHAKPAILCECVCLGSTVCWFTCT
jgi:hypothetical protein